MAHAQHPELELTAAEVDLRMAFGAKLSKVAGQHVLALRQEVGIEGMVVSQKSPQDFVTEMDRRSEDIIRDGIASQFPDDGFIGEESEGSVQPKATWVVDPIDGTTNFIRGFDSWAVSIALVSNEKVVGGIVYNPPSDRIYSAKRGSGAQVNGERLLRKECDDPSRAMAIVGYGRKTDINDHILLINTLYKQGLEFRNYGAAAIDLIHVAEGKADLCFIHLLQSWDALAGLLIASEAGAHGFCLRVSKFLRGSGPVLCGDPNLIIHLKPILESKLDDLADVSFLNS